MERSLLHITAITESLQKRSETINYRAIPDQNAFCEKGSFNQLMFSKDLTLLTSSECSSFDWIICDCNASSWHSCPKVGGSIIRVCKH